MNHLVLGGTGTLGTALIGLLLDRGDRVRVLSRSRDRAATLAPGAEAVIGDLTDPDTYPEIFAGLDTLFLLIGNTITELHEGLAAVTEARAAGASRVVYLSAFQIERGPQIPHFAAKVAIERALRSSGLPFTILRPNNYFQNDLWFRSAIVQDGIYPQPIGNVGVSRVDVRDVASAAVVALTEKGHDGWTYNLVGPHPLTGDDCARSYAEAIGRPVCYGGDDLVAFGLQARQLFPAWLAWDATVMYDLFQREGMLASAQHLRETEMILGRPPRSFEDFACEMAALAAVRAA